jgi:hypothetical protein
MSCVIRNHTLHALGVTLIELYYRKPIVDLYQETDGPRNTGNAFFDLMTEFRTADQLAESLLNEAGARYSDAVRHCIRCGFEKTMSIFSRITLIDTYGFGKKRERTMYALFTLLSFPTSQFVFDQTKYGNTRYLTIFK